MSLARRHHAATRGSLLLWTLTFNVALLLLVIGSMPFFQTTVSVAARSHLSGQALFLARAGIEHALWDIGYNPAFFGTPAAGGWTDPTQTACDDEVDGGGDGLLYGMAVTACRRFSSQPVQAGDGSATTVGTYTAWVVNFGSAVTRVVSRGFVPNTSIRKTVTADLPPVTNWTIRE